MDSVTIDSLFNETTLMWFAVAVAVAFLLMLVMDFVRRRRRLRKHYHVEPESLFSILGKPFSTLREIRQLVSRLIRRRERERKRLERVTRQHRMGR